jgi:hypothetical protein
MRVLHMCSVIATMLISSWCFAQEPQKKGTLSRELYEQALAEPDNEGLFQQFLQRLPTATLGTETKRTYYVFEGDLLLTKEQVRAALSFQAQGSQPAAGGVRSGELLVMVQGGKPVFWAKGNRALTYAVDRPSFPSEEAYRNVVRDMAEAAKDWEDACSECGLSIRHQTDFDNGPSLERVTFVVQFQQSAVDFIAAAFFPHDPIHRRILIIAPSFLTTTFDSAGVLRHEIGHILGYRHEHIRGIPGCFKEDNSWKPLTPYDPQSTMHYFCGNGGSLKLNLTPTDAKGHRQLYR